MAGPEPTMIRSFSLADWEGVRRGIERDGGAFLDVIAEHAVGAETASSR
jgi:hypothetical protein